MKKNSQSRVFYWIYLAMLLWPLTEVLAQLPCGTTPLDSTSVKNREQRILQLKQQFLTSARVAAGISYIPIKAHIVRNSDGSGGLSLTDLNKSLLQTNRLFINSNIQFYFCGSPNYINNTAYYDYNNSSESAMCASNDVNNAINIYFINTITFGGIAVSGYTYFPANSSSTNRVFIQASSATDTRTVPHELGHFFVLYHTFQGSISGYASDKELVTRVSNAGANCQTAGDLLCDTPSDPFGRSSDSIQVIGCTYSGNARDSQGQLYSPLLSNIMSYYPISCGNNFTSGQYAKMTDGLLLRSDPNNQYNFNCSATVVGLNVPSNLIGTINNSALNLSFVDNSSNETGFVIERSSTSATSGFIPVAGLAPNTTTYADNSISAFTTYYYRVKASNSSNQYSTIFQITTNLNYCVPLYENTCNDVAVIIDDFILRDVSNSTVISNIASGCSVNSYGNFTATSYNVEVGKNYNFTARAVTGGTGTYFDQHLTIWIDYNRDGVFKTSEIVYKSNGGTSPRMNPTATGSFTIPNITSGIVRMRLRSGFGAFAPVVDSCNSLSFGEAEDYNLNVISILPTISSSTVSLFTGCSGQNISVAFTTTIPSGTGTFKVQLSNSSGSNFIEIPTFGTSSPLTATIPNGIVSGSGYKVRVVSSNPNVTGLSSIAFSINAIPTSPVVVSPINYQQNQVASPLEVTGTNLKWYFVPSGGSGITSTSMPIPLTITVGTTTYYVSQTVSACESARSIIQVKVIPITSTTTCLNVKVFLEGVYSGGQMTTLLNSQGILPGQTPVNPFSSNTPSGQPYNMPPWNYSGTETVMTYDVRVVDWVILSLRTNPTDKTTVVYKTAALLNSNGTVTALGLCPALSGSQQYYVGIDHRNHIGAISHQSMSIINNAITYDFTTQDSYIPSFPPAYGQKLVNGVYCLIAGDCQKMASQEINVLDNNNWRLNNGKFSQYLPADINLDGEVNAVDILIWRKNNGKYSGSEF